METYKEAMEEAQLVIVLGYLCVTFFVRFVHKINTATGDEQPWNAWHFSMLYVRDIVRDRNFNRKGKQMSEFLREMKFRKIYLGGNGMRTIHVLTKLCFNSYKQFSPLYY